MKSWINGMWRQRVLLSVTAFCYLGIAVLSSVPGSLRPNIAGLSDKIEHVVAFLLLGILTVLVSPRTVSPFRLGIAIIGYAAVLEGSQIFIPSRVASLVDLGASATGAALGVLLTTLALRLCARTSWTTKDLSYTRSPGADTVEVNQS